MDYIGLSTILSFPTCGTRQCVNVSLESDGVLEDVESFGVTLERTPNLDMRITLKPVDGIVYIIDDGEQNYVMHVKLVYMFIGTTSVYTNCKLDVLLNQVCQHLLSRAEVESKFLMVYTHDVVDSEVLLTAKGAWLLPMTMVCHQSRQIM